MGLNVTHFGRRLTAGIDRGIRITITAALLVPLCWAPSANGAEGDVEIETRPEINETRYCNGAPECRLCWTTTDSELNRGIAANRSRCNRPLASQLPDLRHLLDRVLTQNPQTDFHTLFWGRLTPDTPQDDLQMAQRLALAAFRSADWDRRTGKPRSGDINHFVKKIADSAGIYPELRELFAGFGKNLAISDVEKVLVLPAGQLPFYDQLKAQGVGSKDRLPFDAMVWFKISKQ